MLLVLWLTYVRSTNRRLRLELTTVRFDKQSQSSRYGKMSEQFMPFLESYPYDEHNFRFIGTPIDGLQFEPDKVVFVEFKTGKSQMSPRQRQIQDQIINKKVEFKQIRIK